MTKDEAIKLSLVAFEEINKLSVGENAICLPAEIDTAMDACREALAQPEPSELDIWKSRALQAEAVIEKFMAQPEPVIDKSAAVRIATSLGWEPKRKPLTDEEIILIVADCASSHQHTDIHFARAIEAAHGIKE